MAYTDISGGLRTTSRTARARPVVLPGGPTSLGIVVRDEPGAFLAWTGDFDPAIEGHGTLTASNVVGQGVVNGLAPSFADVPGGRPPGMVIGGAPKAKLAPMGDIYFSLRLLDPVRLLPDPEPAGQLRIDVTSNSYGNSESDNDGFDAASQEADIWNTAFGVRTLIDRFSSGNGAPGYGTTTRPRRSPGCKRGRVHPVRRDRLGLDQELLPGHRQRRHRLVGPRVPVRRGPTAIDVVADGAYSSGDATLNTILNGDVAWTTWGGTSRSTPVAAGAAAHRLPGLAQGQRHGDAGRLRAHRPRHHQVLGQGPGLRQLDAGRRIGRRLCGGQAGGRVIGRRRDPVRVAAGRLSRDRLRGLPAHPGGRRVRQPDVLPRRPRDTEPLGPLHDQGGQQGHLVHDLAALQGERPELQRPRLPDRHQ